MFASTFSRRILFNFVLIFIYLAMYILLFHEIYTSDSILITFVANPFNICERYPDTWFNIKIFHFVISCISALISINLLYPIIFSKQKIHKKKCKSTQGNLSLLVSNDELGHPIILPEASLYQNILITGTIGSGKTSSAMYPFTRQLIKYKYEKHDEKLGLLRLDVKGNYYSQVKKYASHYRRQDDLVVVELRWKY